MTTHVEVEVFIRRPVEEVFAYITNFENNPKWQSGMKEAVFTSEGPVGVGTTYRQVAEFLGKRIESTFEVTEFEANHLVRFHSTAGTFPIRILRKTEPVQDGTQVTALIEGDAGGVFRLFEPLLNWFTRRSINQDYARLKILLEAG